MVMARPYLIGTLAAWVVISLVGVLALQRGEQASVLNGGVGNYNAVRYVSRFFKELATLEPTDIVVQYFLRDAEDLLVSSLMSNGAHFFVMGAGRRAVHPFGSRRHGPRDPELSIASSPKKNEEELMRAKRRRQAT